jgi:hypothetical protein
MLSPFVALLSTAIQIPSKASLDLCNRREDAFICFIECFIWSSPIHLDHCDFPFPAPRRLLLLLLLLLLLW